MSYYHNGWAPYVPVAARRAKAEREVAKRRKAGAEISPVVIAGRTIVSTFWGKSWCTNLEGYHDYENRLPRGRSYVRNGAVIDLQISPLLVEALVQGSSLYRVRIKIDALAKTVWESICRDCIGDIETL